MKQTGKLAVVGIIAAVMALSLSMNVMAAKSKTVERQKACVITITAPEETGQCRIGPDDPPVKVVIKGWYWPPEEYPQSDEFGRKFEPSNLLPEQRDSFAKDLLGNWEEKGLSAWYADFPNDTSEMSDEIDPDIGEGVDTEGYAYTKEEAMQYMKVIFTWARDWKAYRGKEFGVEK